MDNLNVFLICATIIVVSYICGLSKTPFIKITINTKGKYENETQRKSDN